MIRFSANNVKLDAWGDKPTLRLFYQPHSREDSIADLELAGKNGYIWHGYYGIDTGYLVRKDGQPISETDLEAAKDLFIRQN